MTTIEQHCTCATLINVFTIDPQKASELAALLDRATEGVMRHVPGFVSANIHVSTDRTLVINYAQRASTEAYQRMLDDPEAREHMGRAAALADGFDPHLYTVESMVD